MENQINKELQKIKKIKMSSVEKQAILRNVLNMPVPSPYSFYFYMRRFGVAVVALVLVLTTSGISALAEKSLPGDALYPIKVGITEPLRDLVQITPAEQASWAETKALRRLDEAQALVDKNKFTPQVAEDLENRFSEHAKAFSSAVVSISTTSPQEATELSSKFKAKVKSHSQKIEKREQPDNSEASRGVGGGATLENQNIIQTTSAVSASTNNSEEGANQNGTEEVKISGSQEENKSDDGGRGGESIRNFVSHIEQEIE